MANAGSPAPDSYEDAEAIAVWETEGGTGAPKPADRNTDLNSCQMTRFFDKSRDKKSATMAIKIVGSLWRERSE